MSDCNLTPSLLLPDQNIQPRYQLQFINKVQDPTYTTDLVRDEIGVPIRVEIYDSYTQSRVSTDCFLSSAKVQLMVVDAEYWKNVLSEREGKRPILTGRSLIIQLKNGVGSFENIVLNDNSSWTKSGFRLAVMVKGEGEEGYFNGERVLEGVSERFRVKDRRGKASKKPDRLELTHSVRSIKKIGKDRASWLEKKNINNVENFLKLYYENEPKLCKILGIKSQSGKEWQSMVEHVMQCADEYEKKRIASNNSSQPQQNCMIAPHPMEGNLFLSTNGGRCVVSLGSSKPNQSYIIEGDVAAINRQHVPISNFPSMNLPNQPISTGRMVQYTGEMHYAGGDGSDYGGGGCGIDSGIYGGCGNYGGIDGGTYGGGGIDSGTYGGGGGCIDNYGGGGSDNYGGSGGGGGIFNYGGSGGNNYGGNYGCDGSLINGGTYSCDGNYGGCGGDIGGGGGGDSGIGGGIYGGGGGGIGGGNVNYGGGGGGNYSGGGGGGGIDGGTYGGGGIDGGTSGDGGNYGGSGNYGGGDGGINSNTYGGGGNYGGSGGGSGNYSGSGIDNGICGGGANYSGSGNYSGGYGSIDGGGGSGNYGGGDGRIDGGSGSYGGGGNYGGSVNYGGDVGYNYSGGDNYDDSGSYDGSDNYSGNGDDNGDGSGGGRNRFDRSFIGREMGIAVADLEGLSLEVSQTGA